MPLCDVFITTKDRPELLKKSLGSFFDHTDHKLYRLTICMDGPDYRTRNIVSEYSDRRMFDYVLHSTQNVGLGPTINRALAHISALHQWDNREERPPFVMMLQDDIGYTAGWFEKLTKMFILLENRDKLAFASGVECIEHPVKKDLGGGMLLKDWIRATSMLGRFETWMSMWPISRIDPETAQERGRPHNGLGSSVDWWFLRNHQNSVCKTGRTNLVIPGLLTHLGFDKSTWLKRELPESDSDKVMIRSVLER